MALLDTIETETAPNPVATIIVLHGLGADGNDFVPVAHELDLSAVGPVRYVFPHANVMPVTVNNGYRMRAWYDIYGFNASSGEDDAGLRSSMEAVRALIARENERGIATERIVLAGFSQGCAMTLMTGLRLPQRLAAMVGMSGYLPVASTTQAERADANARTPIFLAHGRMDNVVAIDRAEASRDFLRSLGYDVEWHEYRMAHSVCAEEIADLNAFLLKALGA